MKKIDLGQAITILANVGVIAGIVFLSFELQQMNRATRLATAESHTTRANEIDRLYFDNPDLMDPLGVDIEDPNFLRNATQRTFLTRMRLRSWQNAYYQYSLGALDATLFQLFVKEVQIDLNFDDYLIEYWDQFGESSYGPEFAKFMDDQIELSKGALRANTPAPAN